MGKRILAVIAGIITSFILIAIVEYISALVYPLPPGTDFKNVEAMKQLMQTLPVGALWFVVLAYTVGSFGGGLIAAIVAPSYKIRSGIIVGCVVMAGGIMNLIDIPHPLWFAVITLLVFVPFAYLGGLIGAGKSAQ